MSKPKKKSTAVVQDMNGSPDALDSPRRELTALAVLTLALFALKAVWAVIISTGPTISDELRYTFNAGSILAMQKYPHAHYPPAYPLAIAPALLFKQWYEAILVLNAFWSSLVVPATWFLARSAGVRNAWFAAVLAAVLPMHVIYPNMLLSENLFVPLFATAMALALRGRRSTGEALAFGLVLGCAHLTRYLFLPALPLLFGVWLYAQRGGTQEAPSGGGARRFTPAVLALFAYGLIIGIWLIYGRVSGFSWGELFGLGNTSITRKASALVGLATPVLRERPPVPKTFGSLIMWAAAYASYLTLAWLPVWGSIVAWASQLRERPWRMQIEPRHFRFLALSILFLGGYWLLAVLHSYGAAYNYPVPERLIGRYLMQLAPVMLVVGLWMLERLQEQRTPFRPKSAFLGMAVLAGCAATAWWILYNRGIWALNESVSNRPPNVVDAVALSSLPVFLTALAVAVSIAAVLSFRKNGIRFLALPVAGFLLLSLAVDAGKMYARKDGLHFREIAAAMAMLRQQGPAIRLYYESGLPPKYLNEKMLFWGAPQKDISAEAAVYEKPLPFASLPAPTLLFTRAHFALEPLREFAIENARFYVYRVDGVDPRQLRPKILDLQVRSAAPGRVVPGQASITPVFVFKYDSASPAAYLSLDNSPLKTNMRGRGIGSAPAPEMPISRLRTAKLRLHDPFTQTESDPLEVQLAPQAGK